MRILFITSSSINGGAQKHIREMFISLTNLGHDMYIAAPKGWLLDELSQYKGRFLPIHPSVKSIRTLKVIIENIKPDITNTFILSGGIAGTLAWREYRYGKLFITVNNPVIYDGISWWGKVLYPILYRWMSKYASAFLVKSDKVRNEVATIINDNKPVVSIKNGIDFDKFDKDAEYPNIKRSLGIESNEYVITNVAVLDERKGQQYLIEAVTKLRKKYPVHLILVGEGPYRNVLEKCVNNKSASQYIHFLGRRSDINAILANSNIFVLSSNHEGLPNSLMEAMAMGLPCVTTDVGGVRQLITDSNKGYIVSPKSIDEIEQAVDYYLSNIPKMREVGSNAFEYMKSSFEQQNVTKELLDIYNKF